jgi:hypothetical protein
MYKSIYIDGCSFFNYPWEWENDKRPSHNKEIAKINPKTAIDLPSKLQKYNFGNIIAEHYKVDNYTNNSEVGKSNESILRDTKEYLINHKFDNSFMVIGLTQESRYDVPKVKDPHRSGSTSEYTINKFYIEPSERQFSSLYNRKNTTIKEYEKFNQLRHKVYFSLKHYINDLEADLTIINKILINNNSKLIVINNLLDYKFSNKPYYWNIQNKYNNWQDFIKSYDIKYDMEQHPNTEDHKIFAKELINYLK